MITPAGAPLFSGSIPQLYQRYMVPMVFEPYAVDLAERVGTLQPQTVLEVAAGTGAVTRHLADRLPEGVRIVATDLNPGMLEHASALGTRREVAWRQANASQLPFEDASFDAVVCQFGYMFLPDKVTAYAEARRVLRPGGTLLFNVWDRIEDNEFADVVGRALARLFPHDPPQFMTRIPHGYFDRARITDDLHLGGFSGANRFDTITFQSVADSPTSAAIAFCQGTPLRNEIEQRDAALLDTATAMSAAALQAHFGSGPISGKMQAHVIAAPRAT